MNIHLLSNNLELFLLRAAHLYESIQYFFSLLLVFKPVLTCMKNFCLELYIVLLLLLLTLYYHYRENWISSKPQYKTLLSGVYSKVLLNGKMLVTIL